MTRSETPAPQAQALCLANAQLVLPDRIARGQLVMAEGKILEITESAAVPAGARDMEGDYLIPGLVDLHTDNLERHISPRPKVDWPHGAAILAHDSELAGCGITTVFDALRVGMFEGADHNSKGRYARNLASEILELRRRGALKIRHLIHLRAEVCSETLVQDLADFGPEDRVGILSMMDHTPGQRQFRDLGKLRTYWEGKYGIMGERFEARVEELRRLRAALGAPHEAEIVAASHRLGAVLASHDDTTADQVAVSAGYGIGLAEFPTTVEAAEACRAAGIAIMMGAPNLIRGGSHSGNVAAADLARRGLLDIVSSDYVPGALLLAGFRLGALWGDLPRAIATVSAAPARAAGLSDRGALAPGQAADLLRVGMAGETPVARETWVQGRRVA